jgi:hypothetical protein
VGWDELCRAISQTGRRWILDVEVFVVGRRKRYRAVFLQCNAVRSVHTRTVGKERQLVRSGRVRCDRSSWGECGDQGMRRGSERTQNVGSARA